MSVRHGKTLGKNDFFPTDSILCLTIFRFMEHKVNQSDMGYTMIDPVTGKPEYYQKHSSHTSNTGEYTCAISSFAVS